MGAFAQIGEYDRKILYMVRAQNKFFRIVCQSKKHFFALLWQKKAIKHMIILISLASRHSTIDGIRISNNFPIKFYEIYITNRHAVVDHWSTPFSSWAWVLLSYGLRNLKQIIVQVFRATYNAGLSHEKCFWYLKTTRQFIYEVSEIWNHFITLMWIILC